MVCGWPIVTWMSVLTCVNLEISFPRVSEEARTIYLSLWPRVTGKNMNPSNLLLWRNEWATEWPDRTFLAPGPGKLPVHLVTKLSPGPAVRFFEKTSVVSKPLKYIIRPYFTKYVPLVWVLGVANGVVAPHWVEIHLKLHFFTSDGSLILLLKS